MVSSGAKWPESLCGTEEYSWRMERSLEEEEEEKGVHEIRVRVWGLEERVTSIEFQREREKELRIEEGEEEEVVGVSERMREK